jgi:hypothetical protein
VMEAVSSSETSAIFFLWGFPQNVLCISQYFHLCYMSRQSHVSWFHHHHNIRWSRGSSVSIVSDYGLGDRASIPDRGLCVQTGSGAHPASCTMGTGRPFPGGKERPRRDADTHPHLVPRLRVCRSYTSSPPRRHHGV